MNGIVDGNSQCGTGRHDGSNLNGHIGPFNRAEHDHGGKDIRDHRQQSRHEASQDHHQHNGDDTEGNEEAAKEVIQQLTLGLCR